MKNKTVEVKHGHFIMENKKKLSQEKIEQVYEILGYKIEK